MLFVGIDVAKNKHDCCIIDSDGVVHNAILCFFFHFYLQFIIIVRFLDHWGQFLAKEN